MARHGGSFKSNKRQKELTRLKKQEEKRQRRFGGEQVKESDTEETSIEETSAEGTSTEETVAEENKKDS